MLAACGTASDASSGVDVPATPTVAPSPTATASPSAELSATPQPSAEPTGFGASVFADPDDCINPEAGYRVAYPNAWYSNIALEGIAPCWLFAPTPFELTFGTEIPAEIAIVIKREDEWDSSMFGGRRVLSERDTTVDGLPARVQDIEVTAGSTAFVPGDRFTEYVVELPDGAYLVAATYQGPDYEAARSLLDDMMKTIQIETP